jgi:anaphase-promoting complex subunit 10
MENHQNGKDTHVRGLKIFARDDRARGALGGLDQMVNEETRSKVDDTAMEKLNGGERAWLVEPDWMGEPELR